MKLRSSFNSRDAEKHSRCTASTDLYTIKEGEELQMINHLKTWEDKLYHSYYRPRTYVRREVMFSQVCVCSTFGGGVTPSQVWVGGCTQSQF